MSSKENNRRKFLTAVSSVTLGGLLVNAVTPFTANARDQLAFPEDGSEDYLFSSGLIYLNTGTLGPCRRETIDVSKSSWESLESMPVKFYGKSGAEAWAEKTRTTAAKFLGCDLSEIMITNSTTNGMNSIAQGLRLNTGDHVLITDQEHGGGALCWEYLQKYHGVKIDTIIIPPGENNADAILNRIRGSITSKTRVISISHIFSSTGFRVPIDKVSAIAREKGVLCVVDGAQAVGALPVNVKELGCHAYATSGHKWLMGPKGTGLLYISKDAQEKIRPMQFEHSYNTYNDCSGVVNLPCILGLNSAIEWLDAFGMNKVEAHNLALRNHLYDRLSGFKQIKILSPPPGPLASGMLACEIPKSIDRVAFTRNLLTKYQLSIRPTHPQWFNGIRFSMHIFNTENEVDRAAEIVMTELS